MIWILPLLLAACSSPQLEKDYDLMSWEQLCEFEIPDCKRKVRTINHQGDEFCVCLDGNPRKPSVSKKKSLK